MLLDGDDVLLRQHEWQEVVALLQTGKGGDVYYEKFITKVALPVPVPLSLP